MKNELMTKVSSGLYKVGFKLKKYSPEILIAAGVVGTVASTVMACKATTKLSSILDRTSKDIEEIRKAEAREDLTDQYSAEDARKDKVIVYAHTGQELVKLYAPSAALGALSLTGIIMSHRILSKRNAALAAACAAVDKCFKDYRGRVVERFGEAVDRELRYDIKAKTIEETVKDEKGKEKTVKKSVNVVGIDGYSDYARFFDEGCAAWEKDSEYNLMFLRSQQEYANQLLRSRGHLYLNEVYDMLGIPRTKAGQIVGWVYDPKSKTGDNFVSFGIYDVTREKNRDFVNGYERSILLDFNVDGNILDLV